MAYDSARRTALALTVVGGMLLVGVIIVGAVYDATPTHDAEFNDTVEADLDAATPLEPGETVTEWESSVSVTNSSGTSLTAGTDYEWHPSNGSLTWSDTAQVTDGESMTVVAGYSSPTDAAEDNIGRIGSGFDLGAIVPVVLAAVAVLGVLAMGFGGGGGGRSQRR